MTADERAEVNAEIAAIRARGDDLLEMPVVSPERRVEYLAAGVRAIERLERVLQEEEQAC